MKTICQKEMAVTHFVNGRLTDTAVRVLLSGSVDNQFSVATHHAKVVDALSSHLFYMNNDDEIDSNALGVYTNHITLPPEHRKLLRKIQFKKATAADRYSCICCSLEQELEKDLPLDMTLEIIINDNPHRNVLAAIFDQEINTPKYLATVYMVGDSGALHSYFLSTDQKRMDGKAVFIISEKNPESDLPRIDLELSSEQGVALYIGHGTLDITLLSEFFDKQAIFNHSYLSK